MFDKKKILKLTDENLNQLKLDLSSVSIVPFQEIQFDSSEYRNREIFNKNCKKIKQNSNPIIYTIKFLERKKLPVLIEKFKNFHTENKTRVKNKDRVNISRFNNTNSDFLYVGSSTTKFRDRIKNHFGTRGNRVYSLHLCKWDDNLTYQIKLCTYEIISENDKKPDRILVELIEQQIWDELQPIFGKRSGL
ncbi:hypothetical protein DET49_13018 [Salegentibacter sp. 24]|uniref:hypothetical protein n=1 Tax=Salegentibacter sp. 24 TaxID=2183986 RepID=UPI00105C117A|nr:hypothetical protein [Salegentibacter sp. 24]TDN80806.1 hypothetical protein DET49_13018 [Salegentibacter sp. 24]